MARTLRPGTVTVGATPVGSRPIVGGQRPGIVKDDWTFEFQTWPGLGLIRVMSPGGASVRAVRVDGVDVTDTGYEFKRAQDVNTPEIDLTDEAPQVSGNVVDRAGRPVQDYTVLLFAQDRDRWSVASGRYVVAGRADQNGRFVLRSLPEGKYYAVALMMRESIDWADPAILESLTSQASTCVLKAGEQTTLALRLASLR